MKTKYLLVRVMALVFALGACASVTSARASPSVTLVVNNLGDQPAANPNSGVCETATGNGQCTLRAAIQVSNASGGNNTIKFGVPGTVNLTSALPNITAAVQIDGITPVQSAGIAQFTHTEIICQLYVIVMLAPVTMRNMIFYNCLADIDVGVFVAMIETAFLEGNDELTSNAHQPSATGTSLITNNGNLTMNNSSVSGGFSDNPNACGGGISNFGTLTLNYSTVFSNTAASGCGFGGGMYIASNVTTTLNHSAVYSNSAGFGGGIANLYSSTLNINNSVIYSNTAINGGGIWACCPGAMNVTNSTISGNRATGQGGGISLGNTANLSNVTIRNNSAGMLGNAAPAGGGIDASQSTGPINIKNSIIAGNFDIGSASPKNPDCMGTVASGGYNVLGINTGCTGLTNGSNGDQVGTSGSPLDAKLGSLRNNGGPTLTHALLAASPAINAGNPAGCKDHANVLLTVDQRGYPRPANSGSANNCDIGAFEFGSILRFVFLPLIMR